VSKSDEYRRYAAECLRAARDLAEPSTRGAMIDMARAWLRLAEQADSNSRADIVYEPPLPGIVLSPVPPTEPPAIQRQQSED